MAQLHLKIVTPEKQIFDKEVDQVNVPSAEGELGILPHHTNLMAQIKPGELKIKQSGKETTMAVGAGFLQIGVSISPYRALRNVLTTLTSEIYHGIMQA